MNELIQLNEPFAYFDWFHPIYCFHQWAENFNLENVEQFTVSINITAPQAVCGIVDPKWNEEKNS